MKKLVFILVLLLIGFVSTSQVYQSMPQYGYGPVKRMDFDSSLTIPTTCGVPTLKTTLTKKAAIAYDSCNKRLYYYDPKLMTWDTIKGGSGTTIDTSSLSSRINSKIDSITKRSDTIYYWKNGVKTFAYKDSVGSTSGFVPYTGATQDVDLGGNGLTSKFIKVTGTAGNGHIDLKHQSADATAQGNSTVLFANSNGYLKWKNDNLHYSTLAMPQTADRVFTYQNKSYTLGDSADIMARVKYTDTASISNRINAIDSPYIIKIRNLAYPNTFGKIQFEDGDFYFLDTLLTKKIFVVGDNLFSIHRNSGNNFTQLLQTTNTTNNRTFYFPDTTGTFALRQDTSIFQSKYRSDTARTNTYTSINGKQQQLNGTGFVKASGTTITYDNSTYLTNDYYDAALSAMGSSIKGFPLGTRHPGNINQNQNINTGIVFFVAYYIPTTQTITGVKWWQGGLSTATAGNYNGFGLYSVSGGTLTLVASSTNDTTLFKTSSNTVKSKAFSSTYSAAPGLYYVALLFTQTGATSNPNIGCGTIMQNAGLSPFDFTNGNKMVGSLSSQTSLPSSQALSGITQYAFNYSLFLY